MDAETMASLPAPGEVEFLCGGPPCQGYSGMNRFNKGECVTAWGVFRGLWVAGVLVECAAPPPPCQGY